MKHWLRSGPVSAALGWLIWCYMALCARTIRWRVLGVDDAKDAWAAHRGVIVAGWHGQILLLPAGWILQMRHWPGRAARSAMLISLSPDGEPVARAIGHLGLDAVRGSAVHRRKNKYKGGREAISAALARLRGGGALCVTPDGPRGPARIAAPGPALLARRADAAILPYALGCRPAWRLDTWDRFVIPVPFARGVIAFGAAIAPPDGDRTTQVREQLQKALDEANQQVEDALSGRSPALEPAGGGASG